MIFYTGTHQAHWLWHWTHPLFISARRLRRIRTLYASRCRWVLDSGGFSELSLHGEWRTSAMKYAAEARKWCGLIGGCDWCAIQDWMCEPMILAKTGLSVLQHQSRTIASWRDLRAMAPDVRWAPVLQGWEHDDYLRHADMYAASGTDLTQLPTVGVGSVCRRQDTDMAEKLIADLHGRGIKVHAFGFKTGGLMRCKGKLVSADSMAWSYNARSDLPLIGCTHQNCANCELYALQWRERLLCNLAEDCR